METSMIVVKNCLYNRYFYYMNELPSKRKWIVEYTVDYEKVEQYTSVKRASTVILIIITPFSWALVEEDAANFFFSAVLSFWETFGVCAFKTAAQPQKANSKTNNFFIGFPRVENILLY